MSSVWDGINLENRLKRQSNKKLLYLGQETHRNTRIVTRYLQR